MATPGGHIFVSRGLIECTDSEDALAAVLAHEIAHVQLGHSVQAIKASRVRSAVSDTTKAVAVTSIVAANTRAGGTLSDREMKQVMEAVNTFSDATNEVTKTLVNTGFSKEQEFEVDMLSQIEESTSNTGWGATHPSPKERIKKVQKELNSMAKQNSSLKQAKAVRTERFEAEYEEYKIFEID